MAFENSGPFTLAAGEALAADRLVKLSGVTAVYCDAGEDPIGITTEAVASGAYVAIQPINGAGVRKLTASKVITAASNIYPAADGKVSDAVGNGIRVGTALTAATGDGGKLSCLLNSYNGDLLPGGTVQHYEDSSATKNYPIGTRMVLPDGRVFRYAYADTGGVKSEVGAVNPVGAISSAVLPTQATDCGTDGDVKLTVTIASGGGVAANGVVAADELIGGYVVIGNGSAQHPQFRGIVGNTVVANGGGVCNLTLDRPLTATVTATTTYCEVFANPYAHLVAADVSSSAYVSVLGMPAITCVDGRYFWLQTWGPVWITSDGNTGKAANSRELYFVGNGSLESGDGLTYQGAAYQRAGFAMDLNTGSASNSPCCMLQISQ